MMTLYPSVALGAYNVGVYASIYIKMMVKSMENRPEWSQQDKTSYALMCMLGLGVGEVLGSLIFG